MERIGSGGRQGLDRQSFAGSVIVSEDGVGAGLVSLTLPPILDVEDVAAQASQMQPLAVEVGRLDDTGDDQPIVAMPGAEMSGGAARNEIQANSGDLGGGEISRDHCHGPSFSAFGAEESDRYCRHPMDDGGVVGPVGAQ